MRRATACALTGVLAASALAGCANQTEPTIPSITQPTDQATQPTPSGSAKEKSLKSVSVSVLTTGLSVPWGLDFLPDGDAIVTERDTKRVLRVSPSGTVTQVGVVDAAAPQGEAGLLGVAVSPDFATDHTVFFYITTAEDNRVLRAELGGNRLGDTEVVFAGIPQGFIHDGGRLAFGPDGYLYVSTGEVGDPELAQDPQSLGGKILRLTPQGEPAPDNPDPTSPVWTLGHRNVQGLAFDDQERLWASEFGDSTWDELNLIEKGGNYGWPRVEGVGGDSEQDWINPQLVWPVDEASPSGLAWVQGKLWMAALRGRRLWRIDVSPEGRAGNAVAVISGDYGRLRTVVAAPDGSLWVTTSNRDGRGEPVAQDDRILRVTLKD